MTWLSLGRRGRREREGVKGVGVLWGWILVFNRYAFAVEENQLSLCDG